MSINQFKLTNVLGTVYNEGNVIFTSDGTTLIAPTGNKVSIYDLKHGKSRTLCFNSSHNYKSLALSPNGRLLVAANEIGLAHCISLATNSLLHSIKLAVNHGGGAGLVLKFSPDGRFLAVGEPKGIRVYRAPSDANSGVAPLDLERIFPMDNVATSLDWSYDSVLLLAASEGSPMVSVFSMRKFKNFRSSCFTAHKLGVLGVFFEAMEYNIISVCKGGIVARWICSEEPEEWELDNESERLNKDKDDKDEEPGATENSKRRKTEDTVKQLTRFNLSLVNWRQQDQQKDKNGRSNRSGMKLKCVDLNERRTLAVLGFESGALTLLELPSGSLIQEISIMQQEITTLAFSPEGDWIAMGSSNDGLLVVWEWTSESFVLKQQGHMDTIQCLDFSSDGRWIVTGAQDGKVKLWETQNGFACHTFSEHSSVVTGVLFMQSNKAVVSSSLDGTVRAFDTMRYRNFRTFLATRGGTQFSSVAIDSSNTYIASGSIDEFQVFVWHVQSGRLLMKVSGHTGPVSGVCFSPKLGSSMLASVSWDKSLRIVDCLETNGDAQVITLESEATALAFRPDGKELVVATLNGNLSFINADEQQVLGTVNGRFHMASSQMKGGARTVGKGFEDSAFQTISYSADGKLVLAGGKSPYICIYDAVHQVIVHKEEITKNRSLNQQAGDWTRKQQTEFGVINMIQKRGTDDDESLPGARRRVSKADSVSHPDIIQSYATKFSPGGRMWVAATTEGVHLYTTDSAVSFFSPIDGSRNITPQAIDEALRDQRYDAALFMALKLNIPATTTMVLEKIPVSFHSAIVSSMTRPLLKLCLWHLASVLNETSHVMFHMMLMRKLLQVHLKLLEDDREFMRPIISNVQKAANRRLKEPADISDNNKYLLEVHQVLQMRQKKESPVRQRKLRKRVATGSRAENESDESDAVSLSDESHDENEDAETDLNDEVSSDSEFEIPLAIRS